MEVLSQFKLNPYRMYKVSSRRDKGVAVFPEKNVTSYLDYSVDFSNKLAKEERIIKGSVTVNGFDLIINSVFCKGSYLTAFISNGLPNNAYYLTFEAQTNLGGAFIQSMILSVIGSGIAPKKKYQYLTFTEKIKLPVIKPPLNAIQINGRYLVSDSGLFYRI